MENENKFDADTAYLVTIVIFLIYAIYGVLKYTLNA